MMNDPPTLPKTTPDEVPQHADRPVLVPPGQPDITLPSKPRQ